jgi:hypothetical protein
LHRSVERKGQASSDVGNAPLSALDSTVPGFYHYVGVPDCAAQDGITTRTFRIARFTA